jgi:hypothetical protein
MKCLPKVDARAWNRPEPARARSKYASSMPTIASCQSQRDRVAWRLGEAGGRNRTDTFGQDDRRKTTLTTPTSIIGDLRLRRGDFKVGPLKSEHNLNSMRGVPNSLPVTIGLSGSEGARVVSTLQVVDTGAVGITEGPSPDAWLIACCKGVGKHRWRGRPPRASTRASP